MAKDEIPESAKQPIDTSGISSQGYPPKVIAPSSQASNNLLDMSGHMDAARAWTVLNASAGAPGNYGPGVPVMPVYEEIEPRWEQYNPGVNLNILPRAGWGLMPFYQIRNISVACKEVRLNIELIKRTIRGFDWVIAPVKDKKNFNASELDTFFKRPDGIHDLKTWIELILEDLLTIDAIAVWPRLEGRKMVAAEVISGDTIRVNIDFRGRPAFPPAPAYFQVLWGMPRFWSTSDRLIYSMMHPRTTAPYGMTAIEWIVAAVNVAVRRDLQRIGYFTEGNVPHSFVGLPSAWNIAQIKDYQSYIDALISGDEARTSKFIFIPHDGANIPVSRFTTNDMDKVELDEYLMKVACWAYGNSPGEFGITGGRGLGGAGFMEGMENIQYRTGIDPIVHFIQDLVTYIIQTWLQRPDAKFSVTGVEPKKDQLIQANIDQIKIATGIYSAEFVQDRDGIDQNYRPDLSEESSESAAQKEEEAGTKLPQNEELMRAARRGLLTDLKYWQETAERFFDKSWTMKPNTSPAIPQSIRAELEPKLKKAKSREEIKSLFDEAFAMVKAAGGLHKAFGLVKAGSQISMDDRRDMIVATRHKAEARVVAHILPVMRQQYKKIELMMKDHASKLETGIRLSKADAPAPSQLESEQDKWKRDFIAALILALALAVADLGDTENDVWATYGLPRLAFNANEIIADYQDRTDYDLSRIAGDTATDVQKAIDDWQASGAPVEDLLRVLDTYYSETRANRIAVHETGNVLAQIVLTIMDARNWSRWRWRHIGEDMPCTQPIELDGQSYMGCKQLEGMEFDRNVDMPPDASHDWCHCCPEPVTELETTQ